MLQLECGEPSYSTVNIMKSLNENPAGLQIREQIKPFWILSSPHIKPVNLSYAKPVNVLLIITPLLVEFLPSCFSNSTCKMEDMAYSPTIHAIAGGGLWAHINLPYGHTSFDIYPWIHSSLNKCFWIADSAVHRKIRGSTENAQKLHNNCIDWPSQNFGRVQQTQGLAP